MVIGCEITYVHNPEI